MAAITKVEQALFDLQKAQNKILILAQAGQSLTIDDATEIVTKIENSVETIRNTLSKTTQALRGDLNT